MPLDVKDIAKEAGIHGSPERVPGALFRAMASLFLRKNPHSSRGALVRKLRQRLETVGIEYHERTFRRQLQGAVSSVPPEAETAMRQILIEANGLRTAADIERSLVASGLEVPEGERLPLYISLDRILPLAHLWLYLNPGKSKRFLACRLWQDLLREGLGLNVDSIQTTLAGKHHLARREVQEKLLVYLAEHGVGSETEAITRSQNAAEEMRRYLDGWRLVSSRRFVRCCRLWQLHHHKASSRHLAVLLRQKILGQGVSIGLDRVQNLVNGKSERVRDAILTAMEELLREELPEPQNLEEEISRLSPENPRIVDLCWVQAEPIAALAREWLLQHPEFSMRRLAIRVYKTIRRMGYFCSDNAIQPILGGWKKKTRGFVYRAMLRQFESRARARIPAQHIVTPAWKSKAELTTDRRRKPCLEEYLSDARQHLPRARSPHFLPFVAFRAERLYGIPRKEAEARILGRGKSLVPSGLDGVEPLAEAGPGADDPSADVDQHWSEDQSGVLKLIESFKPD